jgi:hypothetical protein
MKSRLFPNLTVIMSVLVVATLSLEADARDTVLPAGTILQCTLNEPNFSSSTVEAGDPVLCHLREVTEFGQLAFPRGSYLIGHLESAKEPGHFVGKGYLNLRFDRIGLPDGDMPLDAKIIAVRGYRVDKEGEIKGKGHARRDVAEWMFPPLWPWKVIMLPARGPRPKLKGETTLSLRLMDDVQILRTAVYGHESNFSGWPQKESDPAHGEAGSIFRDELSSNQGMVRTPELYATYKLSSAAKPADSTLRGITLFVMKNGAILSLSDYSFQGGLVTYTLAGGGDGVINSDAVDWTTTIAVNARRGERLVLRNRRTNTAPPQPRF